ncbi:MAG TPA: translation elongation factor Ts [Elusimicrobia bacterium]|nr:MAG: translation elongation factor Ts [Elusimicrobia bacterium RIFOXYA12_FULL_49_49]OGS10249.1 MAG: translation elongation factor Ts [Elusimicrobia bacterium RIFOXYA1_FULL_47_7]OGS11232.1 MAG: translation elongation factor Ts [Elusimicrobia bacterium RIFOXYB1_FULL_48_9]OGS15629.1 MAG: translation elongation factor Ts [Elusimicrobia bacterium RIFOXYA2_FULL_47_53]OGS26815.1 MAG: translation elongation factor Ts [Elusimicrobia bacterium RIFOXYB12_FULL_50_12]OGS30728.1 MAG: translation elongati
MPSTELIQKLRSMTGAGMMDCRNALNESKDDLENAVKWLREKGIASAVKKAERKANQGLVSSYIHAGGKLGVLVELNCETDFVARTDDFQNLVKEIAMQIAAANPSYVKREDVPEAVIEKEKEIYKAQLAQEGKPANVVDKIVIGKLEKFFSQVCLMEQPYIRDTSGKEKVKDVLNAAIGKIGENMVIRRFARFGVGEE